MSELYQFVFKLPSIRTRDVRVLYPMAAQTNCRASMQYRMQADDVRSLRSVQIHVQPSEYCILRLDSSEKTALCHFCIQLCCSVHQSRRLSLCCTFKGRQSNSCRADRPKNFFPNEQFTTQFFFHAVLQISYLPPAPS